MYTLSLRWHLFYFMSPRFFAEGVFFSAPVLPSPPPARRHEIFRRLTLLAVRQRGLAAARRGGWKREPSIPTDKVDRERRREDNQRAIAL